MPCSHRCQCWFQDDWLAGLKSLLFTSLKADYGDNVNTGFWRVHTSVTAPYLWPKAGEVKGQPRSSQWAWLNLHIPSRNCLLQWMSVHRNSSNRLGPLLQKTYCSLMCVVWNHSSRSVLKVATGRLKTMTLLGFDTARILSGYRQDLLPGYCQVYTVSQCWGRLLWKRNRLKITRKPYLKCNK